MSDADALRELMDESERHALYYAKQIDLPNGLIHVATRGNGTKKFRIDMSTQSNALDSIRAGVGLKRKDTVAIVLAIEVATVDRKDFEGVDFMDEILHHPDRTDLLGILGEHESGERQVRFFKVVGDELDPKRELIPLEATDYPQPVLDDVFPMFPSPEQQALIDRMVAEEREQSDPRNR